jgi:hypothetical protein
MKLTGTIAFHTDNRVDQAPITGIQREEGQMALDFNMFDDLYTVVLQCETPDRLRGEFVRKNDRLTGPVTCDVYRGAKDSQVLMGNWTEESRTLFWFAQLAPS